MTDYLLVHGAGQGAWAWGKVWGYMTAPVENPPRLYAHRRVDKVYPLDLPGHGSDSDGDTSTVLMDEAVQAIVRAVGRQGLRDVVLVGHGFAGSLILQAAGQLPSPPKRLVLIAGIVPNNGKTMLSEFPFGFKRCFQVLNGLNGLLGKDLKLPHSFISHYLCNGIDPMLVVQTIGYFGPLPVNVLKSKTMLDNTETSIPVTYVVLTADRVLSPASQRRMAGHFPNAEVVELDACHQVMLGKPKKVADLLLSYA